MARQSIAWERAWERRARREGAAERVSVDRAELAWFGALVVLALAAFAAVTWLSLRRWANFEANAYDLAFFDQVIWNSSRGDWFENTFVPYSYAGEHIQPALLLFVPLYWLGAGPQTLVTVQALVATSAVVPLYFFARRSGLGPALAFAAGSAFLANPYLHRALLFDFHVETMAALPFFLAAWAAVSGRKWLAMGAALSLLTFKEDAVFMLFAAGSLIWMQGWRREAIGVICIGLAMTVVSVLVVMPHYRGAEESGVVERYGYIIPWRDDSGLLHGLVLAPWRALREVCAPGQLWTVLLFGGASCFLGMARPRLLSWLLPGLLLALLSRHEAQRSLEYHYAVELVPVALVAAVLGAARLRDVIDSRVLAAAMVVPAVLALAAMQPFEASLRNGPSEQHRAALEDALALIPRDADVSVSVQSGLLPRLSQRTDAREFPGDAHTADWVIVDRYTMRSTQSLEAGFETELERLRREAELVFSRDGVEVFRNRLE